MREGFEVFDRTHLNWIVAIIIFCIVMTFIYYRCSELHRERIRKSFAYILAIAEIIKVIVVLVSGHNILYYLPIHLCGLAIFLILIHSYRRNHTASEILFNLTLPGALIAIIFPGWANEPVMSFLHIHSFVFHALILTYPIMLLVTGEIIPSIRRIWRSAVFLLIVIPPVYFFNKYYNTNYMFLNWPISNSPLMSIEQLFGARGYIFGLVLVTVIMWVVEYSIWTIYAKLRLRSSRI